MLLILSTNCEIFSSHANNNICNAAFDAALHRSRANINSNMIDISDTHFLSSEHTQTSETKNFILLFTFCVAGRSSTSYCWLDSVSDIAREASDQTEWWWPTYHPLCCQLFTTTGCWLLLSELRWAPCFIFLFFRHVSTYKIQLYNRLHFPS